MYDKSGLTERLRERCALTLGWWHNFKQASFKVYEAYANEFFAPLLHFFHPSSRFYVKPKFLSIVQTVFTQVRLAYPNVKDELADLLMDDGLTPATRQYARNLHDLCEFFIPAVSFNVILNLNDI